MGILLPELWSFVHTPPPSNRCLSLGHPFNAHLSLCKKGSPDKEHPSVPSTQPRAQGTGPAKYRQRPQRWSMGASRASGVSLPICEPSMSACRRWAFSLPAVVCGSAALGDNDGARSAADTGDCLHPASCDQDHKRSQAYLGLTEIGKSLLNGLHQMNSCERIFQVPQVPAPRGSFR